MHIRIYPGVFAVINPFVTARVRTNKPHHPRLSIVRLTVVRLSVVRLSVVRLSVSGLSIRGLSISGLGGRRSRRSSGHITRRAGGHGDSGSHGDRGVASIASIASRQQRRVLLHLLLAARAAGDDGDHLARHQHGADHRHQQASAGLLGTRVAEAGGGGGGGGGAAEGGFVSGDETVLVIADVDGKDVAVRLAVERGRVVVLVVATCSAAAQRPGANREMERRKRTRGDPAATCCCSSHGSRTPRDTSSQCTHVCSSPIRRPCCGTWRRTSNYASESSGKATSPSYSPTRSECNTSPSGGGRSSSQPCCSRTGW